MTVGAGWGHYLPRERGNSERGMPGGAGPEIPMLLTLVLHVTAFKNILMQKGK